MPGAQGDQSEPAWIPLFEEYLSEGGYAEDMDDYDTITVDIVLHGLWMLDSKVNCPSSTYGMDPDLLSILIGMVEDFCTRNPETWNQPYMENGIEMPCIMSLDNPGVENEEEDG